MKTELIVATYNNPRALMLSLASVARQSVMPDSIAIADDGSGPETKAAVEAFAAARPRLAVRHVWHEDRGFQKNAILNRAIASSEAELLVFIDGDVLARPDFFARHLELARPDRWSSGSLIRLDAALTPMEVVERLVREFGVAVIPGTTFGLEQGCHLRVAYGALDADTIAEGIGRLVRGLKKLVGA